MSEGSAAMAVGRRRRDRQASFSWHLTAVATAVAGFAPALYDRASRKAPLTFAVGLHGVTFSAWLALFLAQSLLVYSQRIAVHRVLGYVGSGLAFIMIVFGYSTTIAMARRGYDLRGYPETSLVLVGWSARRSVELCDA